MKEYGIQKLFTDGIIYTLNTDGTKNIIIDDIFKYYSHKKKMLFKTDNGVARICYYSAIINSKLIELSLNQTEFKFEVTLALRDMITGDDDKGIIYFNEANIENIDIGVDSDGCIYDIGIVIKCIDKWKFIFDEI